MDSLLDRVRSAASAANEAAAARDATIAEAAESRDGYPYSAIAEAAGLSKSRVAQIVQASREAARA